MGIQSLADPNADRILYWDDSEGATAWLTVAGSLSLSGSTLTGTNTTYTAASNAGLSLSGTAFSVDLGTIAGATLATNGTDKIAFIDVSNSDVTKTATISELATAIAGAG